jgi:hypothetical protein
MRRVRRGLEIARDDGIRRLLTRAGSYLRNAAHRLLYRLTVVLPYALYLRHRDWRYAPTLLRLYRRLYRHVTGVRFAAADTLDVRYVDPAAITGDSPNPSLVRWGRVEPGDWDRQASAFDDRAVPQSLRLHYEEGVPWEETPLRQYFDEMMDRGGAWGYDSPEEFPQRVAEVEALVESVRTDGYRRRAALSDAPRTEPLPPTLDEVTVDVGRNGEYLYRSLGQHRIAAAKLLGVDEIPVRIGTYHPDAVDDVLGSGAPDDGASRTGRRDRSSE